MIDYQFKLYWNGVQILDLTEVTKLKHGYSYNDFVKAKLTYIGNRIPSEALQYFIGGAQVWIYRIGEGDPDYRLWQVTEITKVKKKINEDNLKTIELELVPMQWIFLTSRTFDKIFTSEEESDIAWGIINEIQTNTVPYGGAYTVSQLNFGMVQGNLEITNNTRDRTYEDKDPLTALQQLAGVLDRVPNPQRLRGFRVSPDPLNPNLYEVDWYANEVIKEVYYDNTLITDIEEITDFTDFATRIRANGKDNIQEIADSALTAVLDQFKMRQRDISRTNITTSTSLLEEAQKELATFETNEGIKFYKIKTVDNDPWIGQYRVGEKVKINYVDVEKDDGGNTVQSGNFMNINGEMFIYGLDIDFDDEGIESVKITASFDIVQDKKTLETDNPMDRLINSLNDSKSRLNNLEK